MGEKENNYAFIDSNNLNLAIEEQGWKLNFRRFRTYLADKYQVRKAFLFLGYIEKYERLYASLRNKGYAIIFKPVLLLGDGGPKGNVDAELVLHTMIEWPNYDKAVIVSGDGDFHCLIEHLKLNGKLKTLIIPNQNKYSYLLTNFLKDITFMNNLKRKLEYKKK